MKKNDVCGRSIPINFILLFRIMKLCFLFLVIFNFAVVAATSAQVKRVSLTMEYVELRQVFKKLKQQTGLRFFYNEEKLKREGIRQIDISNLELDKALDEILEGTGLTYTFLKDVVVIKDRQEDPMKALLKEKRLITGVVKDEKGLSLPGVSVIVKGTQTGVATNVDGYFEIKVDDNPDLILQFSFVGMKNKEVRIGTNQKLNIILEDESEDLDEVIVTGYQTISKERATGSFGVISTQRLEAKLQSNLSSLLEGQVTGMVLNKDGNIEIRGISTFSANKEPLVVVDGYPIEAGLESLNPENIANVTVLKDGVAASIYGSRAANGVIVVTTKRGTKDRFLVSYKGIFGAVLRPQLSALNRASTSDYIDAELDLFNQNPNAPDPVSQSNMGRVTYLMMQVRDQLIPEAEALAEIEKLREVDGLKQAEENLFRAQLSHQHNVAISGGNDKNLYNVALNYLDTKRNMIHSDRERFILDVKNDWTPSRYISLGVTANVVYTNDKQPMRDYTDLLAYTSSSMIQPYDNLVDPQTGNPTEVFGLSQYKIETYKNTSNMRPWTYNPLKDLSTESVKYEDLQVRLGGNLRLNIMEGLNVEAGGMWTRGNRVQKSLKDRDAYRVRIAYNDATSRTNNAEHYIPDGSIIDEDRNINQSWTIRAQINFNRAFLEDKHRVSFLAGNEVRRIMYDNNTMATRAGYNTTAGSFIPVNIKDFNAGKYDSDMLFKRAEILQLNIGGYSYRDNRFVSWYGNGSYEFDNRFILSGSIRLDLTNFFGTDPKYRYKPLWSVGGTYKLSNEKFFKVEGINRLHLRGSYGVNGNVSLTEGPFLIFSAGKYQSLTGGVAYNIQSPPNNQLRWEKTKTFNLGTDLSVLDNRIDLSFDYYSRTSSDLLAKDASDPTTGFLSLTRNMGKMINRGVELSLSADIIKNKVFRWKASYVMSYNKNEVKEYNVTRTTASSFTAGAILAKGHPADALFGYRSAGLNDKGEAMGYTVDGEKKLLGSMKVEDVVYQGTLRPKYDMSFTNNFTYRNFDLSFMLIAKLGHKYRKDCFSGSNYQNRHVAERWQNPGDETTKIYPRLLASNSDRFVFPYVDFLVGNASYMKLRDVTLSYNVPKHVLEPIGFSSAKVYFQTRNLFTITAKGVDIDPETAELQNSSTAGSGNFAEYGYTSLPMRPEFYIGLSFSF